MRLLFEGGSYFFEHARSAATIRGVATIRVNTVCGNSKAKDQNAAFHRMATDAVRGARWLEVFSIYLYNDDGTFMPLQSNHRLRNWDWQRFIARKHSSYTES